MNVCKGEVANRILSVGDLHWAWKLSWFFDKPESCLYFRSTRTFWTFTGTFKGVPVTIVATGMGTPMMDFVIREYWHVITGPMATVWLGTCGVVDLSCTAGDIIVASKGSVFIQTNYPALMEGDLIKGYTITKPVLPDPKLTSVILENLKEIIGPTNIKEGGNCTADSFYGSQGWND